MRAKRAQLLVDMYKCTSDCSYIYHLNCLFQCSELAKSGSLFYHIDKNRGQPIMNLSLHWAVDIAEGACMLVVARRDSLTAIAILGHVTHGDR